MNFKTDRHCMDLVTGLLFLIAAVVAFFAHVADGSITLIWLALGALFLVFAAGSRQRTPNLAAPLPQS